MSSLDDVSVMVDELLAGAGRSGRLSTTQQINSMTGWVWVAVTRRREAVAQVPLRLYLRSAKGDMGSEVVDLNDPYLKLLNDPNPLETRFDFWSMTQTFLDLTGNAFWWIERDPRTLAPIAAWNMPSNWIRLDWSKNALMPDYMLTTSGREVYIPREDMIQFQIRDPRNRFWGMAPLDAAANAMRASDAIKAHQLNAFQNEILQALYFSTDQSLSDPAFKRVMATLMTRYAGAKRAGVPLIVDNGLKPGYFARPPAEMAYRDSAAFSRDEILNIFGVPPLLGGVIESANNSNTASQERVFEAYTVRPNCIRIAEQMQKHLSPKFGVQYYVKFDDPVAEDKLTRSTMHQRYISMGVLTPNEVREEIDYPPEDWGAAPRWVIEMENKAVEAQNQRDAAAQAAANAAKVAAENAKVIDASATDPNATDSNCSDPNVDPNAQGDRLEKGNQSNLSLVSVTGSKTVAKVQAGGLPSYRSMTVRRQPPLGGAKKCRATALLVRSVKGDYDSLQESARRPLQRFFSMQRDRIQANLESVLGKFVRSGAERIEVPADAVAMRSSQHVIIEIDGVTGRLCCDGTLIEVSRSIAIKGDVECPCCGPMRHSINSVMIRKLPDEWIDSLDDWDDSARRGAEALSPKLREALQAGANSQAAFIGVDNYSLSDPLASEYLRKKDRDYWKGTINKTTRDRLGEALADVLAEKDVSLDKLRMIVNEVMGYRIGASADAIARTEVVGAYNWSGNEVRSQFGVKKKRWISTIDARVRTAHEEANNQVVDQNSKFDVGGERLSQPGDPNGSVSNIIACRCAAVAVIDDENF
jgi:HK97 family phage portal protein